MSVSRSDGQPLTVQIESWPGSPDAPRQWTEMSSQAKGTTRHIVTHLRPNTIYELKANGQSILSLRTDKSGCARFKYAHGYTIPQKFELGVADQ
jgi:hypothetical protein